MANKKEQEENKKVKERKEEKKIDLTQPHANWEITSKNGTLTSYVGFVFLTIDAAAAAAFVAVCFLC